MTASDHPTCAQVAEAADELALGHLGEPRRGALLAHAAGCDRCDALLGDLAALTDRLLLLAPEADPPPGFEAATVGRLARSPRRRGGSWTRRAALAGAAAAVVLAAVLVLAGDGADQRRAGTILSRSGEPVGTVELELTGDSRIVIAMPGPHDWPGTWTCELLVPERGWVDVGRWTADDVSGDEWATAVGREHHDATAMRILNRSGDVVATAALDGAAG